MDKVRAIIYGVGEMGRISARQLLEKDVQIAAAIGNRSNIGRDLGQVIGLDQDLGIVIRNDADTVLDETEADIVIMTVGSEMDRMFPYFSKCLEHGFNVVTIAEEPYYPWRFAREQAESLDRIAKENGVTLCATGIQEVIWQGELLALSAGAHRIDRIHCRAVSGVDEYGPINAKAMGIGMTPEEYKAAFAEEEEEINFLGTAMEAIAADLGLELESYEEKNELIIAEKPLRCECLDTIIEPGHIIGLDQIAELKTKEKIDLTGEFISVLLDKEAGECECNEWIIQGEPKLSLTNPFVPGPEATCAAMINRVPDVIDARPGFIPVGELPKPKFRIRIHK